MKHNLATFIKAILAGILIGIAGTIYLSLDNSYIGASLFGFGLLVILVNGYNLYTSKIAYIIDNNSKYLLDIAIIIVGNFLGTYFVAKGIHLCEFNLVIEQSFSAVEYKTSKPFIATFFTSLFCGMMMFLAADSYQKDGNAPAKVAIVFCAVIIFILAKFEHSIANMFYFSLASAWSTHIFIYFVIMLVGNAAGALILNTLTKLSLNLSCTK